ncbi:MAG: ABC transporter substrate-binding protein [Oculatellaceae cyanobacterium bins.114]|nr:ABC transporter substrate-binding protein [Oculatellaceae cyanobacterium bins.114]
MTKRLLLLGLMLVMAIALMGCRSVVSGQEVQSQLVLTTLQDPKTFNPALNQEFPNVFMFTMRGLTAEDGVTGEVVPELAESWEFLGDRRLVFTLRSGLKWSDGTPLTAADVVFTYRDVIFNEKIPIDDRDGYRIGEKGVLPEVRQLGDRQIEFVLPEPFAPIVRATAAGATGIGILPKHALQDVVKTLDSSGNPLFNSTWGTDADPEKLVVNGPYRVEQYAPGERIIFRRNPYYWKRDSYGQPLPYVDRIVWQLSESTDTQLLQFRSGDLDVVGDARPLRPEYFSLLKREERRGKFQILIGGPWSGTTFISFNLNRAKNDKGQPFVDPIKSRWFNTLEFRQAIAYAIDRPRMINNLYRGISQPQDSPISVQSPYYLSPQEGLKTYDYDPEKARQLLLSAGFQYNANGQLLDANGNRVQFTLNTNAGNELREAIGAQIKTDLSKIGVQVDFSPLAFQTLISRLVNSRDWDCALIGFTGGVEPHSGANLWTSGGGFHLFNLGPQPGQPPITDWVVSDWERQIDQLFKAGARELDESKRRAIYGDYQRISQEQLPVIHLVHEIALVAVRDRVQGLKYSGLPTWGLWNIEEIRVENEG